MVPGKLPIRQTPPPSPYKLAKNQLKTRRSRNQSSVATSWRALARDAYEDFYGTYQTSGDRGWTYGGLSKNRPWWRGHTFSTWRRWEQSRGRLLVAHQLNPHTLPVVPNRQSQTGTQALEQVTQGRRSNDWEERSTRRSAGIKSMQRHHWEKTQWGSRRTSKSWWESNALRLPSRRKFSNRHVNSCVIRKGITWLFGLRVSRRIRQTSHTKKNFIFWYLIFHEHESNQSYGTITACVWRESSREIPYTVITDHTYQLLIQRRTACISAWVQPFTEHYWLAVSLSMVPLAVTNMYRLESIASSCHDAIMPFDCIFFWNSGTVAVLTGGDKVQ